MSKGTNNKKVIYIIVAVVVAACILLAGGLIFMISKNNDNQSDVIPDDYIAVFHGGTGEVTRETYIYKNHGAQFSTNSGFDYINVTSVTESWGSSNWKHKITGRGTVQWTDDVFTVAKENSAYDFVTLPGGPETYSIEEYMGIFLMN